MGHNRAVKMPRVTIYTDGGSHPNPGPGGWGAVVLDERGVPRELSGSEAESTNNRMELMAAIRALESLPEPSEVDLITDSTYLKKGITEWIDGWRRRGWMTAAKQPVKNKDLWVELDTAVQRHRIRWRWTRGHVGNEWNEKAHDLASAAIDRPLRAARTEEYELDPDAAHVFLGVAWSGKRRTGAWGAVLRYREHEKEVAEAVRVNSSNATHIASAVLALEALQRPLPTHLHTTSDYLRDGATRWIPGWRQRAWKTSTGKPVASRGWWERLAVQIDRLDLTWHVVGRDDLPEEIERARKLARSALES